MCRRVAGRVRVPTGLCAWARRPIAIPVGGPAPLSDVDAEHATLIGQFEFHRVLKYLAEPTTAPALAGHLDGI